MSGSSTDESSIIADVRDTHGTVMVAIAGFTVLVWDHLITFDDEVELIWKRDKGLLSCLFLLNRYLTPAGFIVNLVAFTLSGWGMETCRHFVRYEGAMTVIGIQTAGAIMFLRVRALYNQKTIVVWSIALLYLIWLGDNAWLLTSGEAVPHISGLHSCTMIFGTSPTASASSAWLPLLYDTYIFALTLHKTKFMIGHLFRTLLSDGLLYYSVICMVNTLLTIMITRAGPGTKNIAAQLELLFTVAMVSRITLNLRKQALGDPILVASGRMQPAQGMRARSGSGRTAGTHSWGKIMPWRSSNTFRSETTSHSEDVRLNTIYSINLTSERTNTSPVEAPRFKRPGVEKGVGVV